MRYKFWIILLCLVIVSGIVLYGALHKNAYRFPDDANPVIEAFARENQLTYEQYPESLIQLLERNPETLDYVLNYPLLHNKERTIDLSIYENSPTVPLFLQWDMQWGYKTYGDDVAGITACGPMCLSMATYYLTGDVAYSPDKIIEFAENNDYYSPGNGSSWTLISEGGVKLGFDVTEIPLDKDRIFKNLEVDNPIICVMGPGDFTTTGHFIVLTGLENGMLRVNDPNSVENSSKLWDYEQIKNQIRNIWVIRK